MKHLILLLAGLAALPSRPQAEVYQKIAAKVGSEIITSWDVDSAMRIVEASMSRAELGSAEGKKKLEESRKKILDRMIEEKLVVLAAEKGPEGYKEAMDQGRAGQNPYLPTSLEVEEEVDKAFDDAQGRFPSREAFEDELKKERLSISEFRNRLRERLRSQMTFSRMIKNKEKEFQPSLRVSDEEAQAFYEGHKASFSVGAQVNLRHILYSPADAAKAQDAVALVQASRKPKEDFIALARRESKDEITADKGGRLGWIEKGGLRWSEVEDKAFRLKPGQVGGPVQSSEGLHVIFVDEAKAGEQKGFEEVKAQVRNIVYQEKMHKRVEAWVEDLKREFFVERSDG